MLKLIAVLFLVHKSFMETQTTKFGAFHFVVVFLLNTRDFLESVQTVRSRLSLQLLFTHEPLSGRFSAIETISQLEVVE